MAIACDRVGDVTIVAIPAEELDASNSEAFKREVGQLLEAAAPKLVLDLARLRFVDSSGLGAFISCLRKANARGGDVRICAMSKQVRAAFELVRLHRIFEIYNTREEAARSFTQPESSSP
jgi:anti-sigma B factor antagonist